MTRLLVAPSRVFIFGVGRCCMVGFMASRTGRWLRIMAGAGMVLGGIASGSSRGGLVALVGLVPLVAGAADVCLLGPLFGLPLRGADIRRQLGRPEEESLLEGAGYGPSPRAIPPTIH